MRRVLNRICQATERFGDRMGTIDALSKPVNLYKMKTRTRDDAGLHAKFPATKPCDQDYALKITGLKLKHLAP